MAKTTAAAPAPKMGAETPKTSATAPKFTVERLRKDCLALFGVTDSTFAGATHKLTGKYSVEEMRGLIQKWQNTRVLPALKKEGN